jgi:hypothetical protein
MHLAGRKPIYQLVKLLFLVRQIASHWNLAPSFARLPVLCRCRYVAGWRIKVEAAFASSQLDIQYIESLRTELVDAGPPPGMDEVRRRLAKIPEPMTEDFIAERGTRRFSPRIPPTRRGNLRRHPLA